MGRFLTGIIGVIFTMCLCGQALAQGFLAADYDRSIPTLEAVIGHKPGDKITNVADANRYLEALQAAAPERMQIHTYATSWQGRPLVYGVISSPETMANLETAKSGMGELAAGKGLSSLAQARLVANTPAVTWLSYGVHGDEISSTDAGLAVAYHLLAAKNDATVDTILQNTIVVIDPMQNPDGRARFMHSFESSLGLKALSDRYTAEHDQVWPGGRYNHYVFDLNRDWFNLSQPETRGKVTAILDWKPVVVVDAHEMGGDGTYFFPPAAKPFNPQITKTQREAQTLIGRNHAKWFDKFGIPFFTRQVYDQFYPGYGDMWPQMNGAIAMTYEQSSSRGMKFARRDGGTLHYRDAVRNHFISTLSTAEVVAKNKARFLNNYTDFRRSAVENGRTSKQRYFVIDRHDKQWTADRLGRRLQAQGIDVSRFENAKTICDTRYPSGALVIDQAQPNGRLIHTLLNVDTKLHPDFIKRQESRRKRGLPHELYDVTAWSLPLMDGLKASTCQIVNLSGASSMDEATSPAAVDAEQAAFGYAVPWTNAGQAKLVLAALSEGLVGKATDEAFTVGKRKFPKGTTIFAASANDASKQARLIVLAQEIGAVIVPLSESWVDTGPNYGSDDFKMLKTPKVAMAWGEGTNPTQAGATRFVLERDLNIPVSPIRVGTLGRADLDIYDVLILPEHRGDFSKHLGGRGAANIKDFVSRGGVVIGLGRAVDLLIGKDLGLLSTTAETATSDGEGSGKSNDSKEGRKASGVNLESEDEYRGLIAHDKKNPDSVPGVLVHAKADPDHWLSSGYDSGAVALLDGNRIYRPLNEVDGTNVFRFTGADELLASGYLWEENRKQLAYKPFVMTQPNGDGLVIAITQSPATRGYLHGLTLLMANAVVLGPAHTR